MEMAVAVGITVCFAVLRHAVRCAALRMARKEKMQEEQSQCPKTTPEDLAKKRSDEKNACQ